jgi:hypothetical protein
MLHRNICLVNCPSRVRDQIPHITMASYQPSSWLWLKGDHDEQVQAQQVSGTSAWRQAGLGQLEHRLSTFHSRHGSVCAAPTSMATFLAVPRLITKSALKLRARRAKARLVRWLEGVRDAWDEFQTDRAREAVYAYLDSVFAIVRHFKVRRRTKGLLRYAFEFADLRFDKDADPFTAIIRCTSGGAADKKMISKWARALRYVSRCRKSGTAPRTFIANKSPVGDRAGQAFRQRTGRSRD